MADAVKDSVGDLLHKLDRLVVRFADGRNGLSGDAVTAIRAALQAERAKALEEAAKVCERLIGCDDVALCEAADGIRALK